MVRPISRTFWRMAPVRRHGTRARTGAHSATPRVSDAEDARGVRDGHCEPRGASGKLPPRFRANEEPLMAQAFPASPTTTPSTRTLVVQSPIDGSRLGEVPLMGDAEVRAAVERARTAQRAWAQLPIETRAGRVARVIDAFVERLDELVDAVVIETGKPRNDALAEWITVVEACHYFTRHAGRILADTSITLHHMKWRGSYVTHVPMGVIAVISPWNLPLAIPMGSVIEALIAGNAVVAKPSEVTPLTLLKAKEVVDAVGIPTDLFQVVTGDARTGAALIDAGVQKVVFTGGVSSGRRVGAACAERLIPCVLELGGKAPLIACDDCEIERTARSIVAGGFINSGQLCISVERVLATEAVHDRLVDRVVALTRELRQGDPRADDVDVGAIIFAKQMDIAEAHIKDAVARGALVATGGRRRPGPGMFFEPTVLTRCTPEMTVMREEIFGPVVPIMKVRDEEEAVRIANDSPLGLHAYVFSRDKTRARAVAERIEAGTVMINDVLVSYCAPEAPFGGIKSSGYGRVHSDDSLRAMCYARHVNHERFAMPLNSPLLFPYTTAKYRGMRAAIRATFKRTPLLGRLADLL
ncbi:aldehyde dehydrogenase family protein [Sorangium sp. So ce176]|uniref:aldehyde dehydrogenase family protein n=1 Tax=Sorangium sp. So ce176 TaxID=3133286 RepID=UPI003F5F313D